MKKLTILGSTGSIGTQTLDIVRNHPTDLTVVALSADTNVDLLETQIREFKPTHAAMANEEAARDLRLRTADLATKILSGIDGLIELTTIPEAEMVVTAIVGMIGLRPTIAAIQAGKDIALANKETLVTAGHLIMPLTAQHNVRLLPVDSEHSAIFQSMSGENHKDIHKIILTASGGPFRGMKRHELSHVKAADALRHPNWTMGKKITIDSATLVNKGLEVIEAYWLFGVEASQIDVIIHPQSIIHSMVEYVDGSIIAQMGLPDMKLPIQYALLYPDRKPMSSSCIDFTTISNLTFEEPDCDVFRGLPLAYEALATGGSMPTIYNAANEKAVSMFLAGQINFLDIYDLIERAMINHQTIPTPTITQILEAEAEAHETLAAE